MIARNAVPRSQKLLPDAMTKEKGFRALF